jgi:HK97 family phage portal protein
VSWFRRKLEDRDLKPIEQPVYATGIPLTTAPVVEADQYNALRITDAYACVRVLADTVASLPVRAYRDVGSGRVPVGPDARIMRLLNRPSPGSTSADLFSSIMVHLNVAGNAFIGKWRVNGEIVSLSLLPPDTVQVILRGQQIIYQLWLPNQDTTFFGPEDVLHIKAMTGTDGLVGLSPVTQARLALTLSANLQESSRQYFANGSRPSGVLSVTGAQNDFTIEKIRERWDQRHSGTENMHRIAVLSGEAKFLPVAFSADDSQFLQQRELSAREVARVFRVPAYMIDSEPASGRRTYANVTQEALHFVQHSIRPWLTRIERAFAADSDLCPGGTYLNFDLDGLLRGDPDLRSQIYQRALGSVSSGAPGWMTVNEVRELENMEPMQVEQAETLADELAEAIPDVGNNGNTNGATTMTGA